MATKPHAAFQVATGHVGSQMVRRLQNHPDLDMADLYCYSEDKIGSTPTR